MASSTLAFDILARDDGASAVFDKVARAADKTGDSMKKNSKISADAAKASAALSKARNNETNALDKVQVAEARLADVRNNSSSKTGQVVAAEKALSKARREAAAAGNVAQKAAKDLGNILDNEGKSAGKRAGSSVLHWFTGAGKDFEKAGRTAGDGFSSGIVGALKTPVVGPALIGGLVAAVTAAAIPAGAVVAGGIVLGAGAGLAAIGLKFAAESAVVKQIWSKTASDLGAQMRTISKPFEQTLVSMAGTARKTFATLKPELAGAFKTLAPAVSAFGSQLGAALGKLGPALQPLAGAFSKVLGALGPAMNDVFTRLSASLVKLSESVSKNPTALADFARGVGGLTSDLLSLITHLNDADGAFKRLTGVSAVTALMGTLRGAVQLVVGPINALATGLTKLADLTKPVGQGFVQTATSAKEAATATGYWLQGMTAAQAAAVATGGAVAKSAHETHAANVAATLLAGAYDRQWAATQRVNQSLTQMSGLLLTLSGSEIAYQQAVDDATAAVKANGHTHDINTQKGRDNKTALDQLAASANAQTIAMRNNNASQVQVAKTAEGARAAYVNLAHQMGYTIPQAKAMAAQLIAIPNVTRTAKIQANIADLTSKLATAKAQLGAPVLTATKRAKLQVDISDWESKLSRAKHELADPQLTATKKAQLKAEITDLESKISKAKAQLASPQLTATKRAKLEAQISNLEAGIARAKAALASVPASKTVSINVNTYKNLIQTTINKGVVASGAGLPHKAAGGPVTKGQAYVVGEKRPELFVPNQNGTIIPKVPSMAVGSSIASGMAAGLRGGAGDAVSAAAEVALAVIGKAKAVLGIASPSKAFAQLGLYVNQGFKTGLLGSSKSVQSAMSSLMGKVLNISFNAADTKKSIQKTITSLNASLAAARGRIKPVTGNSKQRASAERGNRQAEASIRSIQAKLKSAYTDLANVNAIANRLGTTVKRNAVIGMLGRENAAMQKLANARAVVAGQLKAAQTKLADAIQVRDDFKKSITDASLAFNAITNVQADENGNITSSAIINQMSETLRKTQNFTANLAKLKSKGLSSSLYQQIAEAGAGQGGDIAAALLGGGQNAINAANSLQSQINSASAGLGATASKNLYQAGVDAAQGLVNGLLAKTKALDAASKKLAAAIVAQIKKTLGIRSPSRVLEWHGSMVGIGFARGIEGEAARVQKAAAGLGGAATNVGSRVPGYSSGGGGGVTNNYYITVTGAVDKVGAAKEIQQLLLNLKRTNGRVELGIA